MNRFIITRREDTIYSSLFSDSTMVQVNAESANHPGILGNIYLGKVKNIVKNINAAFIEVANGLMCYYSLAENPMPVYANAKKSSRLVIGDELLVQISREDVKTKAPTVTSGLNLTGKYVVLTHGKTQTGLSGKITRQSERKRLADAVAPYKTEDYGFIIRTNAASVPWNKVEDEIRYLADCYWKLRTNGIHKKCFSLILPSMPGYLCDIRDGYDDCIDEFVTDDMEIYNKIKEYLSVYNKEETLSAKLRFYQDELLPLDRLYGISEKIKKALDKKVWLKSGGYLVIEPTEALTVIDVNTGKAIAGRKEAEETFYRINLEAADEIARQLRLRNLSGIIIIDFIDLKSKEKTTDIIKHMEQLAAADPVRTTVVDMTELHLLELTRKKVRKPLHEQLKGKYTSEGKE